jgi:hypothetical protein
MDVLATEIEEEIDLNHAFMSDDRHQGTDTLFRSFSIVIDVASVAD